MTFCLMKDLQYKFEDNMSRNDDTARLTEHLRAHVNHGQRQNAQTLSRHPQMPGCSPLFSIPIRTSAAALHAKQKSRGEPLPSNGYQKMMLNV